MKKFLKHTNELKAVNVYVADIIANLDEDSESDDEAPDHDKGNWSTFSMSMHT